MRPRKRPEPKAEVGEAILREATQLAGQARTRLRGVVNGADPASPHRQVAQRRDQRLSEIRELPDPVARLRASVALAEQLAPSLPAGCAEHTLPMGEWWQARLADLEAGRAREGRGHA